MYSVEKYIDYDRIKEFIKLANASIEELIEMTRSYDEDDINLSEELGPITEEEFQNGEVVNDLCHFLNHYEIDFMVEHIDLLNNDKSRQNLLKYKSGIDKKLREIRLAFANDTLYEYFLNMDFVKLLEFRQIFNYFGKDVELTDYGKEIKTILFNVINSKIATSKKSK